MSPVLLCAIEILKNTAIMAPHMAEFGRLPIGFESSVIALHEELRGVLPARSYVEQFRFTDAAYVLPKDSKHGAGHTAKVMGFAALIGMHYMQQPGKPLHLPWVLYAAAYHDSRRDYTDGDETSHGDKAALWLKENAEIHKIPPADLKHVIYLVSAHVPHDSSVIMTDELKVLKDADAFDRHRFPDEEVYGFRRRYIRHTPMLDFFIPIAREVNRRYELLRETTDLDDFSCGMQAFVDTHLIDPS